jgi:glycolate oxidase FAD binding subunit
MHRAQEALARGRQLTRHRPATLEELRDALLSHRALRVEGLGLQGAWAIPVEVEAVVSMRAFAGIVEHDVADHVVVVRTGTTLQALQTALAERRQCLPFGTSTPDPGPGSTLGGLVAMSLPHTLEAQSGSWRDWVIGMRVMLADGTTAKCGSKAVKNVAGFDVQKLFIGARGTLGVITELTLRTFATASVPMERLTHIEALGDGPIAVQRTLPANFHAACQASGPKVADAASSTLWVAGEPVRQPEDWVLRRGAGVNSLSIADPTLIAMMRRAKDRFDPEGKLNPGAMGVV